MARLATTHNWDFLVLTFRKNLESSSSSLKVPFRFFCVQRFLKEALKMSMNLFALFARAGPEVLSWIFRRSCLLSPGLPSPSTMLYLWRYSLILSCEKGLQSSWRDCFMIESNVRGSIPPAFYYCRPMTKKQFMGCLTFSTTGFLC